MVIGGNLSTGVIEAVASSGEVFSASAYAASLVYPRKGQEVLHDTGTGRLFVFKGTFNNQEDNIFELIDTSNIESNILSLTSYRKDFFPVIFDQNVFLFNGLNQNDNWLMDTLTLNIDSFEESIATLLGANSERKNYSCTNIGHNFLCAGGRIDLTYLNDVYRFDLNLKINLSKTFLSSAKEKFSITRLNDSQILIAGGIGSEGFLKEIEIIDVESGVSSFFGSGLIKARANHAAIKIDLNRVLILGGLEPSQTSQSAEILDLTTGKSTELPWRMRVPRAGHTATLLPDGRVLVIGGNMGDKTIEVWNPPTEFP